VKALVARRIQVAYRLTGEKTQRATVERVLGLHAEHCRHREHSGGVE
jgi:hypothetical protein